MTHLLAALPAILAAARWRLQGRGGALAALLAWVWATDAARWLLLPHIGSEPVLWALVDMLWVSWYVAHVLVLTNPASASPSKLIRERDSALLGESTKSAPSMVALPVGGFFIANLAGATLLATAAHSWWYLARERWMGPAAARDIWLTVAGGAWSGAGLVAWSRQPAGLEQLLGMASAGLSLVQVLHFRPESLSWIAPGLFYVLAVSTLTASVSRHLIRGEKDGERNESSP